MQPAFAQGICGSNLVAIAQEGEKLGELTIPPKSGSCHSVQHYQQTFSRDSYGLGT